MAKKRATSSERTEATDSTKHRRTAQSRKMTDQAASRRLGDNTLALLRDKSQLLIYDLCQTLSSESCPSTVVHRIRVTTRKLQALLLLTSKIESWSASTSFASTLKKIRDAAGALRELDVLKGDWESHSETSSKKVRLQNLRQKELLRFQRKIRKLLFRSKLIEQFNDWSASLTSTFSQPESIPNGWIDESLQQMALSLALRFPRRLSDTKQWHQLRIGCKSMRYAIEIASELCQIPKRTELLSSVRDLQQSLGELNDLATHVRKIRKWTDHQGQRKRNPKLQSFMAQNESLLHQRLKRIEEWWSRKGEAQLTQRIQGDD